MRSIEHISIEEILLAGSALLFLSVLASKASARLGVPALLLFLGLGMLAGSDVDFNTSARNFDSASRTMAEAGGPAGPQASIPFVVRAHRGIEKRDG